MAIQEIANNHFIKEFLKMKQHQKRALEKEITIKTWSEAIDKERLDEVINTALKKGILVT